MKKLYTLLLGVAVAVSASALTPNRAFTKAEIAKNLKAQSVELVKTNIQSNLKLQKNSELAATMKAAQKEEAAKQQAAAKIPESWEDAGTVLYADPFLLPLFFDAEAGAQAGVTCQDFIEMAAWEVSIQRSTRNENRIKLIDPYHQDGIKQFLGEEFDAILAADSYDVVIDTSNPDFVSMDLQHLYSFTDEISSDLGIKEVWGWPLGNYRLNSGIASSAIISNGEASIYKNGVITLVECPLSPSGNKATAGLAGWGGELYNAVITFPDAKDVKFNYQAASSCSNNMKHTFSVTLGADMASAKYFLYPGDLASVTDAQLNLIETQFGDYLVDITETTGNDIEAQFAEAIGYGDGPATLILLGYDADGVRVNAETHPVLFALDEPEKWDSRGEVDYTDDIVAPGFYWEGIPSDPNADNSQYLGHVETYKVEIEENKETSRLYRLVNPYHAEGWKYTGNNFHEANGCKHFLYIDATNPDAVEIIPSYPGFTYGSMGTMLVASMNHALETPNAAYCGKLENGVITFPARAILHGFTRDLNDTTHEMKLYYGNVSGKFKVDLTTSGISDVTIGVNDNAPVEYFNLQGVRVANPAAGELVIKRQGDKVSKTVIR